MKKTLLFLLLLLVGCQHDQPSQPNQDHFGAVSQHISNQQINTFAEDAFGHIWIGTFRGLNKYDAHEFHQYFSSEDSLSLPDNQITGLLLDSKKRFWVATVNGLCLYNDRDEFHRVDLKQRSQYSYVGQLLEAPDGNLIVNLFESVLRYNPSTGKITQLIPVRKKSILTMYSRCFFDLNDRLWIVNPSEAVGYRYPDMTIQARIPLKGGPTYYFMNAKSELWVAGNKSLTLLDLVHHQEKPLPTVLSGHPQFSKASIAFIHPYGENSLLINTQNQGMFLYDYVKNTLIHQSEQDFPFDVPRFRIKNMFTDSNKNLWIGSVDQGYTVIYNYKKRFNSNNFLREKFDKKSVIALATSHDNRLWMSTRMDGLFVYDVNRSTIQNIPISQLYPQEQTHEIFVNQMMVDRNNDLWLLTPSPDYSVIHCQYDGSRLNIKAKYSVMFPMALTQDAEGNVWVAAAANTISKITPSERQIETRTGFPVQYCFIPGIKSMQDGRIFVGGLNQPPKYILPQAWKEETVLDSTYFHRFFHHFPFVPTCIYEDKAGHIWIGTINHGLLCFDKQNKQLKAIEGIACTDISSIEQDKQGKLWISTLDGLSQLDPHTMKVINFYASDGIGGNQFNDRASCQLTDGTLVFGGTHGLTYFNPNFEASLRKAPILFESLKVNGNPVHPADDAAINRSLTYLPEIRLHHDENNIQISFAAIDYNETERINYQYKLEGYDHMWIDAGRNHEASYSNLPPGNYRFKVRISDNDHSIENAENSIAVIVRPAPWNTVYAYIGYFIVIVGLISYFVYNRVQVARVKQAAIRARHEKEQEIRVNKMNMSFFANISHEFRTPLTMISGPITQLSSADNLTESQKSLLLIVRRSIDRMLKLVNQLMDFHKLENDAIRLQVAQTDIVSLLKRIIDIFSINARNKDINLSINGFGESYITWLDEDKIEKIVSNLLSNAFKFTPEKGSITVSYDIINHEEALVLFPIIASSSDKDTVYFKIAVTNTGSSIPEDKLDKIFERYYQIENNNERYNYGTGIGLYYARSLATLHHGYIRAQNTQGHTGTVFTLLIPVSEHCYSMAEKESEQPKQSDAYPIHSTAPVMPFDRDDRQDVPTILVVDDDIEVVNYLRTLLVEEYKIITKFDALSALESVRDEAPDLIISDIVMPGADGLYLCKQIKEDMQLCHIPVILVTAKSTVTNQIEGLNTGANAYVTKPFEPSYLLALIKSQLHNRDAIRNMLSENTHINEVDTEVLSPQDNAFMTEMYRLMENELSNPELDIAMMVDMMHISRTKFYYKVKGLTGSNPSVFFKTYKLNRAAQLIDEGKHTISEIADMTGFSTLSHFSSSFKKQFGVAPSEYHK